ncbi:MAG: hypothetical protein KF723_03295 [Rhizobiaceae bacterium]|nr:hypothetical protein [Rhizobiaceae bacterium]
MDYPTITGYHVSAPPGLPFVNASVDEAQLAIEHAFMYSRPLEVLLSDGRRLYLDPRPVVMPTADNDGRDVLEDLEAA